MISTPREFESRRFPSLSLFVIGIPPAGLFVAAERAQKTVRGGKRDLTTKKKNGIRARGRGKLGVEDKKGREGMPLLLLLAALVLSINISPRKINYGQTSLTCRLLGGAID